MKGKGQPDSGFLLVRVTPRASKNEVVGWEGHVLRVRVTAAPVDGEANRAVRALLAKAFGVPFSSVILLRGESGREKLIRVEGQSRAALVARLGGRGPA